MKKTIILFSLHLIIICSMAQYVTLAGKQFKLNGQNFYPVRMCYVLNIGFNGVDFFVAPHTHYNNYYGYGCHNEQDCETKLQENFNQIASMGFNTIRTTSLNPIYVPSENYLAFEYSNSKTAWITDTLPIHPSDPSDLGMHALLSFYDKVLEVANATVPHPLKVIFLMIQTDTLKEPEMALWNEYLARIASHLKTSANSNALFAYDILCEPGYNTKLSKTKQEACEIVSTWYDIVKANDPYHLVTIESLGLTDLWAFDPAILKVDFFSLHRYPGFRPYEDRTQPLVQERARKRWVNELYWFNQVSLVPWIMGETSFSASKNKGIVDGLNGTLADQRDFASFSLDAVCNCGASGYSWWQYQDVSWRTDSLHPEYGSDFYGLLEKKQAPPAAEKQPAVEVFRNYFQNLPPQSTGICPVDYSPTFDATKLYYNPYQHPPSPKEIERIVVDQYNQPIKNAVVKIWTSFGNDATTYILDSLVRDTVILRCDLYETFTDINGYFKVIPSPRYGFTGTPMKIDSAFAQIMVSAAGADIFEVKWNSQDLNSWIPDTIRLHKPKDEVVVSGETVLNGQTKHYKGKKSLSVSRTTINSGGKATFTSQKSITLLPGFVANAGSIVHIYLVPPDCNETLLRDDFAERILLSPKNSSSSTKSNQIELSFETDFAENYLTVFPNPANSSVTIKLHTTNQQSSLNSIKLVDLFGRELLMQQVSGNSYTLYVSSYPKGIYFIEAQDPNQSYHQKIIIQ